MNWTLDWRAVSWPGQASAWNDKWSRCCIWLGFKVLNLYFVAFCCNLKFENQRDVRSSEADMEETWMSQREQKIGVTKWTVWTLLKMKGCSGQISYIVRVYNQEMASCKGTNHWLRSRTGTPENIEMSPCSSGEKSLWTDETRINSYQDEGWAYSITFTPQWSLCYGMGMHGCLYGTGSHVFGVTANRSRNSHGMDQWKQWRVPELWSVLRSSQMLQNQWGVLHSANG